MKRVLWMILSSGVCRVFMYNENISFITIVLCHVSIGFLRNWITMPSQMVLPS